MEAKIGWVFGAWSCVGFKIGNRWHRLCDNELNRSLVQIQGCNHFIERLDHFVFKPWFSHHFPMFFHDFQGFSRTFQDFSHLFPWQTPRTSSKRRRSGPWAIHPHPSPSARCTRPTGATPCATGAKRGGWGSYGHVKKIWLVWNQILYFQTEISSWLVISRCFIWLVVNIFFPQRLGIMIPTDELIFFRGVETTNQTCSIYFMAKLEKLSFFW